MTTERPVPSVIILSPLHGEYFVTGETIICWGIAICNGCDISPFLSDEIVWNAKETLAGGGEHVFPSGEGRIYIIEPPDAGYVHIQAEITCPHGYDVFSINVTVFKVKITDCNFPWMPEKDNTTKFTANIIPEDVKGKIKFILSNVSDEPGYCLNAGKQSTADKDLKFESDKNPLFYISQKGAVAESKKEVNTIDVVVSSFDYGSYGNIEVEAKVQNKIAKSETKNIPKDDDNNHIADSWPYNSGNATDDNDNVPVGANLGDGLTRYEEYRGFMINGVHTRTNPNEKDLFIRDENTIGIGNAGALQFNIHLINNSEWNTNRVINFNGDNDQCGIRLINGGESGSNVLGECWLGTPNGRDEAIVYVATIIRLGGTQGHIDKTIAHEIGHDVDIIGDHPSPPECIMNQGLLIRNSYCPNCSSQKRLH
jgi:hypothetical protein